MKEYQDWADPILPQVTSRFLSDASFGQFLCSTSSYCRPVSSNRFWIFCSVIISSCLGIMPMLTKLSDLELEGPIPPWSNFLRPLEISFFHNPNESVNFGVKGLSLAQSVVASGHAWHRATPFSGCGQDGGSETLMSISTRSLRKT